LIFLLHIAPNAMLLANVIRQATPVGGVMARPSRLLVRGGAGMRGFTLIELMIVVAVVAILSTLAYPSYQQYILRAHRADAQALMQDIAARQQQRLLDVRTYAVDLPTLGMTVPAAMAQRYTITTQRLEGPPLTFTVTAAPIGAQANDACGTLVLTREGVQTPDTPGCW